MMEPREVIDPVCGMTIIATGAHIRHHGEEEFHFCSGLCVSRFDADADAYVAVARLRPEGWGQTPRPGFLE